MSILCPMCGAKMRCLETRPVATGESLVRRRYGCTAEPDHKVSTSEKIELVYTGDARRFNTIPPKMAELGRNARRKTGS